MNSLSAPARTCARSTSSATPMSPRYRHYPGPAQWEPGFGAATWREALLGLARRGEEAVAIEIHVPFCAARCHYCGFDVTVGADDDVIDRYLEAIARELALVADLSGRGREVLQVHLSGGTPNLLGDRQLERLMDSVRRQFRLIPETELSIECDPRRISAMQLDLLRNLGFSSLCLGMADVAPAVQAASGRMQSCALMTDVMTMARAVGFDFIELDFVCGLPAQSRDSIARSIAELVALGPDRITCLRYRHLPSRWLNQCAIDREHLPGTGERDALFAQAAAALTAAGYRWLGADRFVLDTDPLAIAYEQRSLRRNALGLHALPVTALLAFGSGRISEVNDTLAGNESTIAAWQRAVETGKLPIAAGCRRDAGQRQRRAIIDALWCELAVPAALARGLDAEYAALAATARYGWVVAEAEGLRVTTEGQARLERLCACFDPGADDVASPP